MNEPVADLPAFHNKHHKSTRFSAKLVAPIPAKRSIRETGVIPKQKRQTGDL